MIVWSAVVAALVASAEPPTLTGSVMLDGKPVLVGGGSTQPADSGMMAPMGTTATTGPAATSQPFAFGDIGPTSTERIIRIPISELNGSRFREYNIVIKPGDLILVPTPKVGLFHMGGHIGRSGAYNLTGPGLTLKQAVIDAGMLDPVAIPQRTDLIRRVGRDREVFARVDLAAIFEGKQPDIFLKPDDTIMVGTNILAPFIAAVRNAFRFSYGAGFFYDRNFNEENTGGFL